MPAEQSNAEATDTVRRPYRVQRLVFGAGSRPTAPPLAVEVGPVTVLVGPNNSGKSTALREIETFSRGGDPLWTVLTEVGLEFPLDPADLETLLRRFERPRLGGDQDESVVFLRSRGFDPEQYFEMARLDVKESQGDVQRFDMATFAGWLTNPGTSLRGLLGVPYTLRLDGRSRFRFVEPQPTGDLREAPANHLWYLAMDDGARERVRTITAEALGRHFVIDATGMQRFRIRLSDVAPTSREEELGLGRDALAFHARAPEIGEFGDGVQAFVGIVAAAIGLPHTVLLVDEPEAFLSPPLARVVGRTLARVARERGGSLIAATHSAEFLAGCLEVVPESTVVRLARDDGVATARTVTVADVAAMMQDPLLRSGGVLQALFHRAAVVTEANGDRTFYDEINRRLTDADRGLKDALFLNGQSLQVIWRMVAPLRKLGVPTAAIVDLDVLEEPETNWERLLDACRVPDDRRTDLNEGRREHAAALAALPSRPDGTPAIKRGGVPLLSSEVRATARRFLDELASYGLFVVPTGALESWLPHLKVRGRKSDWLANVFRLIGQSEADPTYLAPGEGDAWGFLDSIAIWATNPGAGGATDGGRRARWLLARCPGQWPPNGHLPPRPIRGGEGCQRGVRGKEGRRPLRPAARGSPARPSAIP